MALGDIGAAIGIAFTYFTIIYLTGLGGLFSERSGIVKIGLEGMMIVGTVTGSWGAHHFTLPPPDGLGWGLPWGPIMGLLIGMLAGATFATIHALATVTFRVDHIVSGVVINLVAVGLARFLSTIFFGQATQSDPGQPHLHVIRSEERRVGKECRSRRPAQVYQNLLRRWVNALCTTRSTKRLYRR